MRIHRLHILVISGMALLLAAACKKSETDSTVYDSGYSYFPVNTGHEVVYDVDSVVYDDFNDTIIHYTFQKRVRIAETFTGLDGSRNQQLEWYRRSNDTLAWDLMRTGSQVRKTHTAEVVDNNERIVRLVFPVAQGRSWNGNMYTTQPAKEFRVEQTNLLYTSPQQSFTNCALVIQRNDSNLIEVRYQAEIFAKGVGVVDYRLDSVDTQFDTQGNPVVRGLRYHEHLRSYVK